MRLCFSAISIQTHKCKNSLLNSLIKFRAVIAFFYLYSLLISIQQTSNRQSVLQLFLYFYFYLIFITEAKKTRQKWSKVCSSYDWFEIAFKFSIYSVRYSIMVSSCAHRMHAMIVSSVKHVQARIRSIPSVSLPSTVSCSIVSNLSCLLLWEWMT